MTINMKRGAGLSARPALAAIAVALAIVALFALHAPRVSAHAGYDHSTPGDGEVVASSPATIDVYFKEEMSRASGLPTLVVVNDSGDEVSSDAALDDNDRTHMSATLDPDLPDGTYTVIWHNVSADDGDEAQGAFYFYVGSGPSATTPAASSGATNTAAPTATQAPVSEGGDSGDIPVWGLIVGIVGGVVVGGGGGLLLGRRG
ncbi:MAG TPA: copper resistance protein CopC [Dehalococcoidia bacterium]|jgi:methionine-rich copper-binding protein CopC|nr:copper resistance protein CopC [Dehalococcoidia bacterium]